MNAVSLRTLLVAAFISLPCGCDMSIESHEQRLERLSRSLHQIRIEVVDLTSVQEPLANKRFIDLQNKMTPASGSAIADLIVDKRVNGVEAEIAVFALTGLSETDYWKVTAKLLKAAIDDRLKNLILSPHFYGPGYSGAFKDTAISNELASIRAMSSAQTIRNSIDNILSGNAERHWFAVLAEPDAFGWKPEYLERFRSARSNH